MKTRTLLLPMLLTAAACRHIPARAPSQSEIQREAPAGGLVRVTLRDAKQPYRFSSYLVDVSQNTIVDKADGATRAELESLDSTSMKSAAASKPAVLMSSVEVYTECINPEPEPGCLTAGAWNGDPHDGSGGGGDPTGHDPLLRVLRVAALSFWSIRQVGIPVTKTPVIRPAPTRQ